MSSDNDSRRNERPIRSDRRQPPRGARTIRSDADSRRKHLAGEYGERREDKSTGVGLRRADASPSSRSAASPDERLRELIRERLTEDPDIDASDVTIMINDGRVTLAGTVVDERARDVIEQCVENCGARAVDNRLSMS